MGAISRILTTTFEQEEIGVGCRPPFDDIMMFKILVQQRYVNLSDEQIPYQILDRLRFLHFLGLALSDRVPDEINLALTGESH